jgi:methyltransferase (TIGR00027 family)
MLRAAHMLLDGGPKILHDPVTVRLLGPSVEAQLRERAAYFADPGARRIRVHVVLRSRFAEERFAQAVARGATQMVQLGAGLDTFAYRQPSWSGGVRLFEVDHPASQVAKRERLAAAGIALPQNLTYAPVDFEHETLDAGLARAGFDPAQVTFVSCLGVLVYLTMEAIDGLFGWVAKLPGGSECAFTFGGTAGPDRPGAARIAARVAELGEPFRTPMELDDVRRVLAHAGLGEPELPREAQVAGWMGPRMDGLEAPKRNRMAAVVVRG